MKGSTFTRRCERTTAAAALASIVLASGCGDLTSGGIGELEVVVAADSVSLDRASGANAPGAQELNQLRQAPPDQIQGTLIAQIQVFVLRAPDLWIEVTEGVQEVTTPLSQGGATVLARRSLVGGRYRILRTVFHQVEADVESGLEIEGEPIIGLIPVDLGQDGRLQVERPVELDVRDGAVSSIAIDLHARRWLRLLDRDQRRVNGQDFENELRFRHRP